MNNNTNPYTEYDVSKFKKISISSMVIDEIIEKSNYKEFGARKIDKIIKSDIEDTIIENMIKGNNNISIKTIKVSC